MNINILKFSLVVVCVPAHLLGYVGRTAVMQDPQSDNVVILYGDRHERNPEIVTQAVLDQHELIVSSLQKALKDDSEVRFLYEGIFEVEARKKEGFRGLLDRVTELHNDLSHGVQSAQCIDIDNRDFIRSEVAQFLENRELEANGWHHPRKFLPAFFSEFENVGREELYRLVYRDLLKSLDDLGKKIDQMKGVFKEAAQAVLVNEFNRLKEVVVRDLKTSSVRVITLFTPEFLDLNALLVMLSNSEIKKQVLFAGLAHMERLEEWLKQCGYKELYLSEELHCTLSRWTLDPAKAAEISIPMFHFSINSSKWEFCSKIFRHLFSTTIYNSYNLYDVPIDDLKYIDMPYNEIIEAFSSGSEK